MSPTLTIGDPRRAVVAPPLLARFNLAGVLAAADLQVARRLGALCGEQDERVLLATALLVRAVRGGSVCLTLADREQMLVPEAEDFATRGPLDIGGLDTGNHDVDTELLTPQDLPDPVAWADAIEASAMVGPPVRPGTDPGTDQVSDRPLRWVDGRLYLDRYWRAEQLVREQVDARLADPIAAVDTMRVRAAVHRVFGEPDVAAENARQRLAAACATHSRLTVLTGGPGTGKTTTVAGLVAVLRAVAGGELNVALAAPTGKAAARLQEAVRRQVAELPDPDRLRVGELDASTVHRLLGWRPGSNTRFRHDRNHHLPHDLVVVDETSMVSLPLMARLLEAMRPQARLVLVGDPDQLASVEAGAVLGDLVARATSADSHQRLAAAVAESVPEDVTDGAAEALRAGVVRLVVERRFGTVIGELARAVREGRDDDVIALLRAGHAEVSFVEPAADRVGEQEILPVRADAERAGLALVRAARAGDVPAALSALESHRLLVAHRRGPYGVAYWSARVEGWVTSVDHDDPAVEAIDEGRPRRPGGRSLGPWYPGRPVLVTANDRESGLYNGDAGVLVAHRDEIADGAGRAGLPGGVSADRAPSVVAAFGDPSRPILVRPHRLPAVETVHAMTVHRAQGSQFARVSVLLPTAQSPLLTRELLYTALTRARSAVCVVGSEQAVRAAVHRPVRRASGLRYG